ncbi:hypothetical protein KI688_000668 [Linnemannia hyalina]|uniref:F-box domain-containing protein n=1 Tax=Linnemannia hyalina TaxID=64524 RepID=A0A9P7Y531_9FUNG|nr:hypothetical protein KI688_000668 [Linnemannia hyalina]
MHSDVLDILKVSDLPHLRYLRLFLSFNVSPSAIEELFPLLSRLDEFSIRSNWYRELDSQGQHFLTYTSWKLKRLAIDHAQIQYFLKHFPSLEELTFKRLMVKWICLGESFGEGMLLQLLDMPRLKTITVSGIRGTDAVEYRTEDAMGLEALWRKAIVAKIEDERGLR